MTNKIRVLLVVFIIILNYCGGRKQVIPNQPPTVAEKRPYILGPRDVINITVSNHPELSGNVAINSEGEIELPLTEDIVQAAGLTIHQLEDKIKGK